MRARIRKIVFGAAVVAGLGLSLVRQEAQANDTVWLWKDGTGKCPAVCDGSQYVCPCRTASQT